VSRPAWRERVDALDWHGIIGDLHDVGCAGVARAWCAKLGRTAPWPDEALHSFP
jgi:hypothetical protein